MSVLQDTVSFMREAERLVIGQTFKPDRRLTLELVDAVVHAPWFVIAGMSGLFYTLVRGVLLTLVWGLLLSLVSWVSRDGSREISMAGLLYGGALLSVGSILLGLPSSLLARCVREEHVSKLAIYIASNAPGEASAKLLREGVERVETTGQQRLSAIGWALGFIWALLLWVVTNWVLAPDVPASLRSGAASYGLVGFFIFAFLVVAFTSYREAHRMLSHTIAFAFLEAESVRLRAKEGGDS